MANVENDNGIAFNGEQYPVEMRFAAIDKLAHLKGKGRIFGGKGTAVGKFTQRLQGFLQSMEPAYARFACLLGQQPFQDKV